MFHRWMDMRIGSIEATEMKESLVMHFSCLGITQNISFFCFLGDRQSSGETCVEGSGNEW